MMKLSMAGLALVALAAPAQAHQIWIEQTADQNAVVRFGEFGDNLRETSPGLLDKFGKPTGALVSADGERKAEASKTASGFALPFKAAKGQSILAEDPAYPLYKWKQADKEITNRYYPAARLITDFSAQQPKLALDLTPTGERGQLKLTLNGKPKAKTKVTMFTQSGWAKEATTDEQGLVSFDMPWKGPYVAEVSLNERTSGERPSASGAVEAFDGVSYATTLTYYSAEGAEPIPAGPPATPNK